MRLTVNSPTLLVLAISLLVGLLMVVVFRYTSDQKAIRVAKDRLAAHLLALRLFQDQIGIVLRSYGRVALATGHYIVLTLKPLLFVTIPLIFLIVQLDRYLGSLPIKPGQPFLVKARVVGRDSLYGLTLQLPRELATDAPAVHVPSENEVVWRVVAANSGNYVISIRGSAQGVAKSVVVGAGLSRLSPVRLQGRFWERVFLSSEPQIPGHCVIEEIEVQYPPRNIVFAGMEWNWIWLFFVASLAAGYFFKMISGIEI